MTYQTESYALIGTLKDTDGNKVNVNVFAFEREHIKTSIDFYTTQGFTGELTLTTESDNGDKHTQKIKC